VPEHLRLCQSSLREELRRTNLIIGAIIRGCRTATTALPTNCSRIWRPDRKSNASIQGGRSLILANNQRNLPYSQEWSRKSHLRLGPEDIRRREDLEQYTVLLPHFRCDNSHCSGMSTGSPADSNGRKVGGRGRIVRMRRAPATSAKRKTLVREYQTSHCELLAEEEGKDRWGCTGVVLARWGTLLRLYLPRFGFSLDLLRLDESLVSGLEVEAAWLKKWANEEVDIRKFLNKGPNRIRLV